MDNDFSYKSRIVCFIDILAFSNRIKQTIKDQKVLGLTCDALVFLGQFKELVIREAGIQDIQITQFSDSIVISLPSENDANLYLTFGLIKFLQVSLLLHYGILLRGGIVIGDMIHTDSILVGPAIIAAYELESKCAFSPRIVIDPKVVFRFNRMRKIVERNNNVKRSIIHKDSDDTSYIDYFNIYEGELSGFNEDNRFEFFRILCKKVSENVNSTDISIRVKYLWMRNKIKSSILFKIPKYAATYKELVTNRK